ncbi:hemolysin family protein [Shewanella sp. JM162201]|uniref:Polyamine export protein n=1 Tax=Shewanella jiangmenensis TaxID=2837387 RepID=A0ABS5V4M7_9GAMM|nr:hemolysin family protein [Shewanella jiangmenensis]MBT1445417.1 hemolysin family protein [Shewanella jiangmenensis]
MGFIENIFVILLLISVSCFFSMSEIALAAARKIRLRQLADEGNERAAKVLELQAHPGNFFTVVQIGLNAVAIMGGIVGESAFTPHIMALLQGVVPDHWLSKVSFLLSFLLVTSLFILLADLMPKRIAMAMPERVAMRLVGAITLCITVLRPLVWLFNALANGLFRMLRIPTERNDAITEDDIYAVMDAGAEAGVLDKGEQQMMENVFEMQSVPVTSAMTARESLVFFRQNDTEDDIKRKITQDPHNQFLVCDGLLDSIKGYVNSTDVLIRLISGQPLNLKDNSLVRSCPIIPDTLSLSEALDYFRNNRVDFAVVMNEYALVIGVVTFKDLQSAVMGSWVLAEGEEQIVARDASSWLVDGVTPITDVMRAFGIDSFPQSQNYETIAGFIMFMLRKIPRRTDFVVYAGYKFEVVDIDSYKVDQLLVTRVEQPPLS